MLILHIEYIVDLASIPQTWIEYGQIGYGHHKLMHIWLDSIIPDTWYALQICTHVIILDEE